MANNPYTSVSKTKLNLKRNVWDWSHDFHFTTEIGRITPCFCTRLGAGQSLSIKAVHAEQFMPMMFPVQNRIRSRISFFKIPIRALWKDYMDYISSVNQVDANGNPLLSKYEEPYIGIDSTGELAEKFDRFFGTCSTLDYLGLPTTYDEGVDSLSPFDFPVLNSTVSTSYLSVGQSIPKATGALPPSVHFDTGVLFYKPTYFGSSVKSVISGLLYSGISLQMKGGFFVPAVSAAIIAHPASFHLDVISSDYKLTAFVRCTSVSYDEVTEVYTLNFLPLTGTQLNLVNFSSLALEFSANDFDGITIASPYLINCSFVTPPYDYSSAPWYNKTTKEGLKISSYPLRAFEAIYNAYFRYDRNNPLSVAGIKKYNDWVLCRDKGGNDSDNYSALQIDGEVSSLEYFYGRKYCNWEPDMFTTAVQSPQEGTAPLVGLTTYVTTSEENGVVTRRLASVLTDEDGQSYNVSFKTDENGLNGVEYERTSVDEITGTPVTSRYKAVSEGISIEDFRQVNAYQRYLELNMRRGYSYKDIIEGRFDVHVRYDELLMPEFCGGFTRDVNVNPVTQTTPTDESGSYQGSLGSQAGQAFGRGSNKGNIKIYADEDSIVIGIVVVWPDPVYSQNLPKYFLYRDPLDVFNPEFANIGFQPIKNSEVAPIQVWNNDKTKLHSTFGYQRPWYEMLSRVSEAHGLYRTQLRNFLMYRKFSGVPQLSKEFLLINPNQVNDVFSVTETTDKIFGMIRYFIRCKNSVPRNNVPRLE